VALTDRVTWSEAASVASAIGHRSLSLNRPSAPWEVRAKSAAATGLSAKRTYRTPYRRDRSCRFHARIMNKPTKVP